MIVVGIGNADRGDDAVGLRVAERLTPSLPCFQTNGDPSTLITLLGSDADVVVVDAMVSGRPPGTITTTEVFPSPGMRRAPTTLTSTSTHGFGVYEAVELARILGMVPQRLTIIGIEAASFTAGADLTPALQRAVDRVSDLVMRWAAEQETRV